MKKLFMLVLLLFVGLGAQAQDLTVSGTVTSADDGLPLPGVAVSVKGTTKGTITNFEGQFEIAAPAGSTLLFSFIGMESLEILVTESTSLEVEMQSEASWVEEVVVIGYGTVKQKDITGAVSTVSSETIRQVSPIKMEQALQGTVAGVNVTPQSGAPGAGLDIRIRGISTNGNAAPVAIIDGYIGDLGTLNPADIETITVLKDAQAAIYGTVGANGIILVTTKQGRKNTPTSVRFNTSYSVQETTRMLPVLNATEYAVLLNESYAASGLALPFPDLTGLGEGVDWQAELFERAPMMNTDISIDGGSEKTMYAFSASTLSQEGIIGREKTGFGRQTARVQLGADLTPWLKANTNLIYTHINRQAINDFGLGSVLFNAFNMPSTLPVRDAEGEFYLAPGNLGIEIINPLAQVANTHNEYFLNKLNGNFGLDAHFLENFTATARVGFNTTNSQSKSFAKIIDYGGKVFDVARSSVSQDRNDFNDYTFDGFVTYDNNYAGFSNHHFVATLGTSVFKTWGSNLSATGFDVPNNSWEYADLSLARGLNDALTNGSWVYDQRRLSYFARVQYDFQGKYLASFMFRRDASSKFGPENTAAYFPSATLGWVVSEEGFMSSIPSIDLLKMRLSYGILGSDQIGDFQYISQLGGEASYIWGGQLINGRAVGALPNPGIQWEQSEQFDLGVDLKMLGYRLEFTADFFSKTTNNLLIGNIPVSGIFGVYAPGASGPTVNAGTVRNSGVEAAIGFRGMIGSKFHYGLNYNITMLQNEVLEVNNGNGFVEGGSFGVGQPMPARMEVGFPIGYFYGYQTSGIFQNQAEVDAHPSQAALGAQAKPGDLRFVDANGDGVINADDRVNLGDPIPDFVMGFNVSLRYAGFDFVAYTFASVGNEIVRNFERAQPNVNRLSYAMDRWHGEGTSTTIPRLTTEATSNNVFSDYFVENGSYLRMQNIQLGYTVPATVSQRVRAKEFRAYVGVNNLFTLTRYSGYDPVASSGAPIGAGFDSGFYPAARIYMAGLNIKF